MRTLICLSLLLLSNFGFAQQVGDLSNKDLTKIPLGFLEEVLNREVKINGDITKISVVADKENSLKCNVSFDKLDSVYVKVEVLDAAKRIVANVTNYTETAAKLRSPFSAELKLGVNLPPETDFTTTFLRVQLCKNKSFLLSKSFTFSASKRWKATIAPSNIILQLKPTPIGAAAQLPATAPPINQGGTTPAPLPTPKKVKTWDYDKVYTLDAMKVSPAVLNAAVLTQPKTAQPASSPKTTNVSSMTPSRSVEKSIARPTDISTVMVSPKTYRLNPSASTGTGSSTPPPATDKNPKGASLPAINLWENIESDVDIASPVDITNIRIWVFPDANAASNTYYYLPASYRLKWNKEQGHALSMIYKTASASGTGEVNITASITPNLTQSEKEFIKILMKANGLPTENLKLLPIDGKPIIELTGMLNSMFNVPADKVSVGQSADIYDAVQIGWSVDENTKAEMEKSLQENLAIEGKVSFGMPAGSSVPTQEIPLSIRLADNRTFGRFDLQPTEWRTNKWVNNTPYPVKMNYLHVLLVDKRDDKAVPMIYSYDLKGTEVLPASQIQFDGSSIPTWLEDRYKNKMKMWLDYAVVDCDSCDTKIMDKITESADAPISTNIAFTSPKSLEIFGADRIDVSIKTRQVDVQGQTEGTLPTIQIKKDGDTYRSERLFVPKGERPKYSYKLTLLKKDGDVVVSDWQDSEEQEIYLGKTLVEGIFKGVLVPK